MNVFNDTAIASKYDSYYLLVEDISIPMDVFILNFK